MVLAALNGAYAGPSEPKRVFKGFDTPESSFADPESGYIFVSNMGPATAPDHVGGEHQGYLSVINPAKPLDKDAIIKKWVTGLDSPRGVRVYNGLVYVVERNALKLVRWEGPKSKIPTLATDASLVLSIPIPDAGFLNDVVIDETGTTAYVSDTFKDRIWKITNLPQDLAHRANTRPIVAKLIENRALMSPNGLFLSGKTLYVVGTDTHSDDGKNNNFQKTHLATPLMLDLSVGGTPRITAFKAPTAGFDGVALDGAGKLLVGDFGSGEIRRVDPEKPNLPQAPLVLSVGGEGLTPAGIADFSYDAKTNSVIVPANIGGEVRIYALPTPTGR